jgi:VIT1/CCC1 family predicted Fe2+/Mn2+ transporter
LSKTHGEKHFAGSAALRDIVIGMSDGLTVPFALAAGLSGASIVNSVIVTAGIAELVAGAISMGLGGYLAGRAEVEHYDSELRRETLEIHQIPNAEKQEIRDILKKFGISRETQEQVVDELARDKQNWLRFMMEFELGLQQPEAKLVKWGALRIGVSYALGGFVPLSAYFLTKTPQQGLILSSALTVVALAVFGFLKNQFLDQPKVKGAIRMVTVGALAAATSFFVAQLVSAH